MTMNKPFVKTRWIVLIIVAMILTACYLEDEITRRSIEVSDYLVEENLKFDKFSNPQGIFTSDDSDVSSYSDALARRQLITIRESGESSFVSYLEAGNPEGNPIILLHGTPSQAFLWRKVIPHLPQDARIIAPDLIGYGWSSKHDIDYSFKQHAAYLQAFIAALELVDDQGEAEKSLTFVAHDIGSIAMLAYASRFPGNIRGLVFFEAMLGPVPSFDVMPEAAQFFRSNTGQIAIMEDNLFMDGMMFSDAMSSHEFTQQEKAIYRLPFIKQDSRNALAVVPREVPILGGAPDGFGDTNIELLGRNAKFLMQNPLPRLFIYALPGVLIQENSVGVIEESFNPENSLTITKLSGGKHFLQEDIPEELGDAIQQWYENIN
ncbi:MAG: alpha/beta fold hydrolase [Thiohalomonadales bacterium]